MVVPRVERRAPAGLVTTTATREGMTPTDESLFRGAARAARPPVSPCPSATAPTPWANSTSSWTRGCRPTGSWSAGSTARTPSPPALPLEVARRGAYVGLDHVGSTTIPTSWTDRERAALVLELVRAGHADRILLSSNAIGVAKGSARPRPALQLRADVRSCRC